MDRWCFYLKPVYYYHESYRVQPEGAKPHETKSKVKTRDVYLGTSTQVLEKIHSGQP
ncbi:MAG: hypothetical protein M1379_17650 [Firmicutes bacterium]|nr:hypothetical protein [Bacillota bacterium]